MLRFSKGCCSHSFHPVSTKQNMYSGEIQAVNFSIYQTLKVYGTLKISYLIYIASIHNAMLISSGKRSSRASRPLGLFFFFFNLKSTIVPCCPREKPKTSVIWKISNHRAKRSEIWDSQLLVEYIWHTFDLVLFKVIWGSFGGFSIFCHLGVIIADRRKH